VLPVGATFSPVGELGADGHGSEDILYVSFSNLCVAVLQVADNVHEKYKIFTTILNCYTLYKHIVREDKIRQSFQIK